MNESPAPPDPEIPNDGLAELGGLSPRDLFVDGLRTPVASGQWEPPSAEHVARLLPQFRVEALIGHGGMGAVYRAAQPKLDRLVAIKLLPAELAANDEFVARFEREARTLAKLHHPNIVGIHDFGQTTEGHLYFVMEFVNGTDLARIITTGSLEAMQALELTMQICEALQYAHSQHVIHRDIKPANVLVTQEGQAKLADFGLARPLSEAEVTLTASHLVMGTPDYMAPEQRAGLGDHRVDIYALGVMLYEMLTGRRPRGVFDPPSMKVKVDVRLDEVVVKAMREEPERRYQQASEMRLDVDHIRTTPQPKVQKTKEEKSSSKQSAPTSPPPAKARRGSQAKRPWLLPSVVAAALAILAVIAVQSGWLQSSANHKASDTAAAGLQISESADILHYAGRRFELVSGSFSWTEAKAKATAMGGHLVTITNREKNDWVKKNMARAAFQYLWIGGLKEAGTWKWITGEPWQFTDWGPGEPSGGGEDKLEIRGNAWNDIQNVPTFGSRPQGGFMVEWDAPDNDSPSPTHVAAGGNAFVAATKESPFVNTLGMKLVPVPIAGGPTNGQRVLFSIWLTRVQDYETFVKETNRRWPESKFPQGPTHPATHITWDDAEAFCTWLTQREKASGKLGPQERYRLPLDHEWSCAVGIGGQEDSSKSPRQKNSALKIYPWQGDAWPPNAVTGNYWGEESRGHEIWTNQKMITGYRDGFPETSPVGSFTANAFGLFDMSGNTWEWCEDWFDEKHDKHTLRGGSFACTMADQLYLSHRRGQETAFGHPDGGFRVARKPLLSNPMMDSAWCWNLRRPLHPPLVPASQPRLRLLQPLPPQRPRFRPSSPARTLRS